MKALSRRDFLGKTAVGLAAAGWLGKSAHQIQANPLGLPIGCQSWTVRQSIGKDFDAAMRQLAGEGFQTIEMCSPPSYRWAGFGALVDVKPSDLRDRIHAAGLNCESCHFGFGELKDHLSERLDWAHGIGLKQMIISTYALRKDATMDDWMRAADASNTIGEQTQKAGLQLGLHNHDFEFQQINGQLIYDKLMSELDPKTVKMQFQVSVVRLGYKAVDYLQKYPGRFISMHLQDWSPTANKEVALGQGVVDWAKTFDAAKAAGVKNYFVEMEDPEAMKASVIYLRGLS